MQINKLKCAATTKACGFKSNEEVAGYAGVNTSTLRRLFHVNRAKYQDLLYKASQAKYAQHGELITKIMGGLRNGKT